MYNRIGIVGAGAIGCSLGSAFYEAYGSDRICYLAKRGRAEKLRREGVTINGKQIFFPVYSQPDEQGLDLLIVCVKNYSLEDTIVDIRNLVAPRTVILPLLNGVTAVERLREAFPHNVVPYGIVMRTDAERIGQNITVSVRGEVQIGSDCGEELPIDLEELRSVFTGAGIDSHVYHNMRYMLWRKWMINIGSNQVSVLTGAKFKYFGAYEEIIILVRDAIQEILDISRKMNIGLTDKDREDIIQILINYPPEKKTSMLQDIEAHRRTEIDYFAGTVMMLGEKVDVPTPVNRVLYYAIKAKEKVGLAEKALEEEEL